MRASALYQPSPVQRPDVYNTTITWGDASTETVKINYDGRISLNGVSKKLIGFADPLSFPANNFWHATNQAVLSTEYSYLSGLGVRLISPGLYEDTGDEDNYDSTLTLLYNNKMLVVPLFNSKGCTNFDSLTDLNFNTDYGSGLVQAWLARWVAKVITYPNVIGIFLENELDYRLAGQTYVSALAETFFASQLAVVRGITNLPVFVKTMSKDSGSFADSVQHKLLPYSAIPCVNLYQDSAGAFTTTCTNYEAWLAKFTDRKFYWATEMGSPAGAWQSQSLTAAMVNAVIAKNASTIWFYCMNSNTAGAGFFDNGGAGAGAWAGTADFLEDNLAGWQIAI